jgi:type IV secretory pathway TrbL component
MAKKGIFKKILKGAAIVGGSIIGVSAIGGAVRGIKAGTGVLAGLKGGVGGLRNTADKLKEGAARVVTGTTKEERAQVLAVKNEARAAADKLQQVNRLIRAGSTPEEARAMVGISETELTEVDGEKINSASIGSMFSNPVVKWGAVAVGLFFLAKALKIIK